MNTILHYVVRLLNLNAKVQLISFGALNLEIGKLLQINRLKARLQRQKMRSVGVHLQRHLSLLENLSLFLMV